LQQLVVTAVVFGAAAPYSP